MIKINFGFHYSDEYETVENFILEAESFIEGIFEDLHCDNEIEIYKNIESYSTTEKFDLIVDSNIWEVEKC